jgi:predicted alpha/beta-fold hydrolase
VEDGGTLGLDWDEGIPDPSKKPTKPLLIIIPGVGGDSNNVYSTSLLKALRCRFKIVTLLCRGNVPLTSAKL